MVLTSPTLYTPEGYRIAQAYPVSIAQGASAEQLAVVARLEESAREFALVAQLSAAVQEKKRELDIFLQNPSSKTRPDIVERLKLELEQREQALEIAKGKGADARALPRPDSVPSLSWKTVAVFAAVGLAGYLAYRHFA